MSKNFFQLLKVITVSAFILEVCQLVVQLFAFLLKQNKDLKKYTKCDMQTWQCYLKRESYMTIINSPKDILIYLKILTNVCYIAVILYVNLGRCELCMSSIKMYLIDWYRKIDVVNDVVSFFCIL